MPAEIKARVDSLHEFNPDARPPRLPFERDLSRNPGDASHRDRRSGHRVYQQEDQAIPEIMIPLGRHRS